jgi:hypothetical protein
MSGCVNRELDYLRLFLTTTPTQQRALISTITPNQTDSLTEIFHNFLILPLNKDETVFIKKRRQLIRKLSDITKRASFRKKLLLKHSNSILKILNFFKEHLLDLLSAQ